MSPAPSEAPIRVGVVGAGANTRAKHLPGLQQLAGVAITVVCNRSAASSEAVAKAFAIPRIAHHWLEVVKAPDVDAVVIGTWPYLHADVTVEALNHGKHVLTEARMARNAREARRMLEAAAQHPQLVAQVVPAPMSLDVDTAVQELIRTRALGDLREVCVTHTGGQFANTAAPMTWRQDEELSGINTLALGIVHEIVGRWLGEEPRWVMAEAAVFTPTRRDPASGQRKPVTIPDTVTVLGRYASDARLIYHLSGVETGAPRQEIRLNGSEACLRFAMDTGQLFLTRLADGREQLLDMPPSMRRGWRVEEDFVASIRAGKPVELTSFEAGVRYMEFLEAVWYSWHHDSRRVMLAKPTA